MYCRFATSTMVPAVQPSLLVQPSPGKKFKIETVSDNIVMVPVSHRKFIWAPVLDSLAETPATLPLPPSSPPQLDSYTMALLVRSVIK